MNLKYFPFLLISALGSGSCFAADAQSEQGAYVGVFGGSGAAIATSLQQKGAVHLPGGRNLPINANGSTGSSSRVSLGGVQVGYEWDKWGFKQSRWGLKPSVELEGLFLGKYSPTGTMPVKPSALGTQYVTIPTQTNLLLANAIFTIKTPYSDKVFPYVGAGAGVAFVSLKGTDSANPSEPGINHFNSGPNASATAFAFQLKTGLKAEIKKNLYLFTEYRYLSINATSYKFGATDYPGLHFPTAPWHVNLGRQQYNFFVAGLQYKF